MLISDNKISGFMVFIVFFGVCFFLYFNGLNSAFIFDDNFLIVDNVFVKNFDIAKIFTTDIFHFKPQDAVSAGYYYRPFQSLSYSLEHIAWGLKPIGYRITNILLHSLNSFFIFLIICLIFKNRILAFLSGMFFCIHPAQVCLVTFIAGRSNLLETFFMLLSVLMYINWLDSDRKRFYCFSLLLYAGALLCREGALLLPLYLIICALFLRIKYKKIILSVLPYAALSLLYLVIRNMFLPSNNLNIAAPLPLSSLLGFVLRLQDYFWQLILPLPLKVEVFAKHYAIRAVFYLFSSIIFSYLLVKAIIHKNKIIAFGLIMYFVGLVPLIKLGDNLAYLGLVFSEHYVYNASIGFSVLLACSILGVYYHHRKFAAAAFIAVSLFFSILTIASNSYYKNELSFYEYVLRVDKHNPIARLNLGNVYYAQKEYARAIDEAKKVLRLEPEAWDAYLLLGNIYAAQGKKAEAVESFQEALRIYPRSVEALNNLALIYRDSGEDEKADDYLRRALLINPEYSLALQNYHDLLFGKKLYGPALGIGRRVLRLEPHNADMLLKHGITLAQLGRAQEAESALLRALKLKPGSFQATYNLAALYGNMGKLDKAVTMWKAALRIKPDDKDAKDSLKKAEGLIKEK
ncbi:MAG: tetratricopeptide repeat protein [Candidatus Omnitrophota bacterium]